MAKITERVLKDACTLVNTRDLIHWEFGLKVERFGDGFMLYQLFRKPGQKPQEKPLFSLPLPARETMCFIHGFSAAIAITNTKEKICLNSP
jgi:hypothetical protein